MPARTPAHTLTADQVRKVARLSRLAVRDDQIEEYRAKLEGVLGYMERLRELDLSNVEPMSSTASAAGSTDTANRLGADEPGPTIDNATLMRMAPESLPPFIKVPKVLDEGGGV